VAAVTNALLTLLDGSHTLKHTCDPDDAPLSALKKPLSFTETPPL